MLISIMAAPKPYLDKKLQDAMYETGYNRHWIVKEFLLEILLQLYDSGSWVFSVREEEAFYKAMLLDPHSEELNRLSKRVLFILGIFPEHLLATGKRVTDIEYYAYMEKELTNRLSGASLPWSIINANYARTVKSLILVRESLNLGKLRPELSERIMKAI